MHDLISVIVPIYNVEKYLKQCVESILSQTYRELEIILVDDGATDGCGQICDEFAKSDERVVVIHKENGGLVSARKAGIQRATGVYVQYVDGDDWIEPDMVEKLYGMMTSEDVNVAMCGHFEDYGDYHKEVRHGFEPGRYDGERLSKEIFPHMICGESFFEWGIFPSLWAKLFRRETLLKWQLKVDDCITMGEDAACTYPLLTSADSICISDECLYHYRQRADSMIMKSAVDDRLKRSFKALHESGMKAFADCDVRYGFVRQWEKYVLFLMIPRAGYIMGDVADMDYLFPFKEVRRGDEIIIYGMGVFGQNLYKYATESGFCKATLCVDRDFEKLRGRGIDVHSPDEIAGCHCDKIVIANSFGKTRKAIAKELRQRFPQKQVVDISGDISVVDVENCGR